MQPILASDTCATLPEAISGWIADQVWKTEGLRVRRRSGEKRGDNICVETIAEVQIPFCYLF
jgi:hypothetical protein